MATTAEEVWLLLGQLVESQKENARLFQESKQEAELRARENARLFQESKQEAELRTKDIDRQLKELGNQTRELGNQTRELGNQIGGLGKKFGSFTEGLALPSMERILQKQFGMEIISPSVRVSKGGLHLEIDVLAYANGNVNTAYVVEVKSHPREESITQLKNLLERFRVFFPEHHNKKVHGILAAVDWSGNLKQQTLNEGLYVASIHDEVFELETPDGFQPRFW
ncbi:MAG: DUF3782 domain-containing protein [Oscillatoriales cyanobacterium CG2_30_44_21]|nr:MAG: DUF3782 domain-containing protein [Oscillatoriales cyanobacterium CG2_30_44_21]